MNEELIMHGVSMKTPIQMHSTYNSYSMGARGQSPELKQLPFQWTLAQQMEAYYGDLEYHQPWMQQFQRAFVQ